MNTNKIIFLIWASGSWKSTIEQQFLIEDSYLYGNFYHIISHATRKPRTGEVDGEDYYFISENKFKEMYNNNEFIQTIWHAWTYKGSTYIEWHNKLEKGNIIMPVLLPSALELKKNLINIDKDILNNIYIIYIDISEEEALKRMISRYSIDFNICKTDLMNLYLKYIEDKEFIINKYEKWLYDVCEEINERLKDIKNLNADWIYNYANYVLKVDNKEKKDVYNEFLEIIEDIFKR